MKLNKTISIILLVSIVIGGLVIATALDRQKRNRVYSGYFSYSTFKQLIDSNIKPLHIYKINLQQEEFILVEYPMYKSRLILNQPSGSPIGVFDKNGILVDRTFDSGGDHDFSKKWLKK